MQKGIDMTEMSGSYSIIYIHLDMGPNIFGHQHIFGKVFKDLQVCQCFVCSSCGWYFNGVCYLICLFFDYDEF